MDESIGAYRKVVWLYDRDHTKHPFLTLALKTLAQNGCDVTLIDTVGASKNTPYRGFSDFNYSARIANWNRIKIDRNLELKEVEQERFAALKAISKDLRLGRVRPYSLRRVQVEFNRFRHYSVSRAIGCLRIFLRLKAALRWHTVDAWKPNIKAFRRLWSLDCDVIVGTRPVASLVGFTVARLRRKRFVYYPFELYGCQAAAYSSVVARLERAMLWIGVDALITQNGPRGEVYVKRGARVRPIIVHNYKPFQAVHESKRLRATLGLGEDTRIVLYEGMLIEGRWLDRLAQASLLLPHGTVLVMMGEQKTWWRKNADAFVSEPVKQGRLIIVDYVPHDELLSYVADADAGIIIYDDYVLNNYLCEPGKLSDYVFAKVPVIAPSFPTIQPLIEEHGVGVCFKNASPEAIARAIIAVLEPGRAYWRPALEQAAGKLVWSTEAPKLLAAITGADQSKRNVATVPSSQASDQQLAAP